MNLEDLFSLKYYKEDFFEYPHHIILQKNENTINFATSSKKSFEELFTILKKYCILDDFNLKYEILEKLGSGYFSIVFEARNKSNGKEFAAKIITKNKEFYQHMQVFLKKHHSQKKFK